MKLYERTEDGTTTRVSIREGLDEINHAQMAGKRDVRTMSSITRTDFAIEYKDGRKVRLVRVDAPAEELQEWGTASASMLLHRFQGAGTDYRAKCRKSIRWYARPLSRHEKARLQTRSEIESKELAHLYTFCPRCEAKP